MRATRREIIGLSSITAGALSCCRKAWNPPPIHFIISGVDEAQLPAGVKAVWDIKLAHAEKTPTRERICLNGLWRWQPVQASSNNPPAGSWGWFKAPGCWPGEAQTICSERLARPSFRTTSWKSVNLRDTARAWYQREITIPADWKGRRISLSLEYLNTFATGLYRCKERG